eukprot:6175541-Pleurochrysis_carterae.AAC.1
MTRRCGATTEAGKYIQPRRVLVGSRSRKAEQLCHTFRAGYSTLRGDRPARVAAGTRFCRRCPLYQRIRLALGVGISSNRQRRLLTAVPDPELPFAPTPFADFDRDVTYLHYVSFDRQPYSASHTAAVEQAKLAADRVSIPRPEPVTVPRAHTFFKEWGWRHDYW